MLEPKTSGSGRNGTGPKYAGVMQKIRKVIIMLFYECKLEDKKKTSQQRGKTDSSFIE